MKRKKRLTRDQKREKYGSVENYRRIRAEKLRHEKAVKLNQEFLKMREPDE